MSAAIEEAVLERARGANILSVAERLGVRLKKAGGELLGPCPRCGGRDRFAVNPRKGVFNCRGCGVGGDAIRLVAHVTGSSFAETIEFIAGASTMNVGRGGQAAAQPVARDNRTAPQAPKSNDWWRTIWRETQPPIGSPVEAYLRCRRLKPPYGASLRFHPSLISRDNAEKPRQPTAALVGLVRRFSMSAGRTEAIGVICAFVRGDGAKAFPDDNRRFHGARVGGGVWLLLEHGLIPNELGLGELVAGEGIESTLSAMQLLGARAGVAALCARGLEDLILPPFVRKVRIAADLDLNETGQDSACLAWERFRREGREARVTLPARELPPGVDSVDFNDILQRRKEQR
jgi:hypothetical protein